AAAGGAWAAAAPATSIASSAGRRRRGGWNIGLARVFGKTAMLPSVGRRFRRFERPARRNVVSVAWATGCPFATPRGLCGSLRSRREPSTTPARRARCLKLGGWSAHQYDRRREIASDERVREEVVLAQ